MPEFTKEELYKADERFADYLDKWAASLGKVFKVESFDGREVLFDGMAVADVWGWLLNDENEVCRDDNFGCVEWQIKDNHLSLMWNTYDDDL